MKCILKHKNIDVMSLDFDDVTGVIIKTNDIFEPLHMPFGVLQSNGIVDRKELNSWWLSRAIPASRSGLKEALEKLNISSPAEMLSRSYGLNLSDQYWLCPENLKIDWHSVNFFENSFSEDIGNILIGIGDDSDNINYMSPDSASDGWLKKKWKIINGERVLFKSGSGIFQQEPYNEVLATVIMKRLGIPCAEYSITNIGDVPYSVCNDFICADTELITAHNILKSKKQPNHISKFEHYINCCREFGVSDIQESLDKMITVDYIIVNEDRHLNNFGLIRNADTLSYVGAAPVYDSGSSMWFNKATHLIKAGARGAICKPFKTDHSDQIKLVSSFDWFDINKLKGIDEEFNEILKHSEDINSRRRKVLCDVLNDRVKMLGDIIDHSVKYTNIPACGNDVEEDIAYAGEDDDMEL